MTWYAAKLPDKGAGATRMSIYVEADSEQAARAAISDCKRFSMYDTAAGTVTAIEKDREAIEQAIIMAGGSNEALTADGEILRRSTVAPDRFD